MSNVSIASDSSCGTTANRETALLRSRLRWGTSFYWSKTNTKNQQKKKPHPPDQRPVLMMSEGPWGNLSLPSSAITSAQNTTSSQRLGPYSCVGKALTRKQRRGISVGLTSWPRLGPVWAWNILSDLLLIPNSLRLEDAGDLKHLPGSVMKILTNITRDLSLRCEILWYQQGVFKHNW